MNVGDRVVWMHEPYTPLTVTEVTGHHVRAESETAFCESSDTMFIEIKEKTEDETEHASAEDKR